MHNTSTISATERVFILKNNSLFSQTPENVLASIEPIMREVIVQEGQFIFKQGDIGNCMYIIHDGEVGIYDGDHNLAVLTKGDFFGELSLLDTEPRSATVQAHTESRLFRLDQEDFYDLMEEREEVMRVILHLLCHRIRTQNTKLRELSIG